MVSPAHGPVSDGRTSVPGAPSSADENATAGILLVQPYWYGVRVMAVVVLIQGFVLRIVSANSTRASMSPPLLKLKRSLTRALGHPTLVEVTCCCVPTRGDRVDL